MDNGSLAFDAGRGIHEGLSFLEQRDKGPVKPINLVTDIAHCASCFGGMTAYVGIGRIGHVCSLKTV